MWEHEKLHVYAKAIDAAVQLDGIARALPIGMSELRDQLLRASTSVALNLAEGAGEFSAPEKARFYRMARRSSAECIAILDIIERLTSPSPAGVIARQQLAEVAAMLTTLIKVKSGEHPSPRSLARP